MISNPHQRTERAGGRQRGRSLRRAAVGTAAAVLCLVAGAGAAQAQTTAPGPAHPALPARMPHITVLNLHTRYLAQLRHVKVGKIAGLARPRGWHPARAAKVNVAGCTEPDCPVTYHGGPVQHNPQVFLVFWGPNWTTDPAQEATLQFLLGFYANLGAPPETWSPITAQYGDGTGFPAFTGGVLRDALADTSSTPPTGATSVQLAAEAAASIPAFEHDGFTVNGDSQIVVATQSGTCPLGFGAPGVCPPVSSNPYCAYHGAFTSGSFTDVPFTNLPYLLDAGANCYEHLVNPGASGVYDGFSIIGGHEFAETVTDPVPDTGWIDPSDGVTQGEIGDKCTWGEGAPVADVTLGGGDYAMQSLWSNAAGGCVLADTSEDTITPNNPRTQTTGTNGTVSLQMTGSSSSGDPLQWSATGLPAGLSISSSGLITGTATTAGTYTPVVSANDQTGAVGSAAFTWNVVADTVTVTNPGNQTSYAQAAVNIPVSGSSSAGFLPLTWSGPFVAVTTTTSTGPTTGVITGAARYPGTYKPALTATDAGGVSGSAPFTWTVKPDAGKQLKETSAKRCLNDNNSMATVGNAVNVWQCLPRGTLVGLGAQKWSFPTTGAGQLKVFGLCLSDPKGGGTGTKLSLAKCTSASSEHWTHKSSGEYVLKLNSLCLTDPNDSTKNGTKVTISKCSAASSQQWALP